MHLLHLSASGHSGQPGQSQSPSTRTPAAPFGAGSRNLSSEPLPSQIGEPGPMQTVPVPTLAAPSITNQAYAQSSGSSPATVTTHGHRGNEAASLPTPEDIMEHSELPLFSTSNDSLLRLGFLFAALFYRGLLLTPSPLPTQFHCMYKSYIYPRLAPHRLAHILLYPFEIASSSIKFKPLSVSRYSLPRLSWSFAFSLFGAGIG